MIGKVDVAPVVSTAATGSNDPEGEPTNIKATDRQAFKRKSSLSVPTPTVAVVEVTEIFEFSIHKM